MMIKQKMVIAAAALAAVPLLVASADLARLATELKTLVGQFKV